MAAALSVMAAAFDDARSIFNDASPNLPSTTRVDQSDTPSAITLPSNEETNYDLCLVSSRKTTWGNETAIYLPKQDELRSSVERRPVKTLPAWYWRVATLDVTQHRDIRPEDYDEHIAELGEADKSSEEEEEAECECGFEDKYDDDASEKTCDSILSEAEFYYELKDERKARKRDLLRSRLNEKKAKKSTLEYAKAREEEVNTAYHAFKKARRMAERNGDTVPLDFTMGHRGREYELFSTEHVEWLYDDSLYPTKQADFFLDKFALASPPKDEVERPVFGQIYLDWNSCCDFGPIRIPQRARRKEL